jgi:hypothetical protein
MLSVVLSQIFMQRRAIGLSQQVLEHQIPAPAFGKAGTIFLAQSRDLGIAVLAVDPSALIAVPVIETASGFRHCFLPARLSCKTLIKYALRDGSQTTSQFLRSRRAAQGL